VQVNGKVRSRLQVSAGSTREAVLELVGKDDSAQKFVAGKEIRKIIFVPDRLINLVV
jgi:leucyl-tRNA synthetase